MNAEQFFEAVAALPQASGGAAAAGAIEAATVIAGVEVARASAGDERKLRSAWRTRQGGGAQPLLLVADDPERSDALRVLGPRDGTGPLRSVAAQALLTALQRASEMPGLEAVREVATEVERLDQGGIPGLTVKGLGTQHLYGRRLRRQPQWTELEQAASGLSGNDWRSVLTGLGYTLDRRRDRGYVARIDGAHDCVVHPKASAAEFARLDEDGRPPEGVLLNDCEAEGAPYGLAGGGVSTAAVRSGARKPAPRPAATWTWMPRPSEATTGRCSACSRQATWPRAASSRSCRRRATTAPGCATASIARFVSGSCPCLGVELGRWASRDGMDLAEDGVRLELERAALTFVFRSLFLLYAESAGHLPMSQPAYREQSLTHTVSLPTRLATNSIRTPSVSGAVCRRWSRRCGPATAPGGCPPTTARYSRRTGSRGQRHSSAPRSPMPPSVPHWSASVATRRRGALGSTSPIWTSAISATSTRAPVAAAFAWPTATTATTPGAIGTSPADGDEEAEVAAASSCG